MRLSRVRSWLVTGAALVVATGASAFSIQPTGSSAGNPPQPTWLVGMTSADVGQSFRVDWLLDRTSSYDLSGTATFLLESFTATTIELAISITNTTNPDPYRAAIASLGFGIEPNATATLLAAGNVFDAIGPGAGPQQTYPGGFKQIDVCIYAVNCSGGNISQLLQAGSTDSFRIGLAGDFSGGSATLTSFATKFQTAFGSYQLPGVPSSRPIPEPEAIVVFLAGLAVLGASVRRRRAA
jgi:hypothetical protein